VIVTRGSENPTNAEICVIVMAIDADPDAPAAIRSVINQPIAAEIVLVNTGSGSFASSLPEQLMRRITLVESPNRRFAGGTRNLGIAHSRAPIVAFLAADCLAHPCWLQARMAAHQSGHDLVSSSIKPNADQSGSISSASWASYVLIHSHRAPRATFGTKSLFFGLSYRREVLEQEGPFDETVRVSEDLQLNRKLRDKGFHPLWDPAVVTLHRYPTTLGAAMVDQFKRGRRSAQYARKKPKGDVLRHSLGIWRRNRARVAAARVPRDDFNFGNRRAVMLMLRVLWMANSLGVLSSVVGRGPGQIPAGRR
jgi:glycosyltransferase involved in cell wall biosynthesis